MTRKVPDDLVSVGYITGAFGVQGWVKVHPFSADAGALLHAKTWWLSRGETKSDPGSKIATDVPPADMHDVEKLEAKLHGDGVVARIMGIVGRDAAESLKGFAVQIQRSHFPVLSDNEYYWLDLIGLAVENCQGESLGIVADLIDNGAHPILRVVPPQEVSAETSVEISVEISTAPPASSAKVSKKVSKQASAPVREYLIPFVDRFVPTIDQKNKKIIVDWGLDF